MERIPLHSWEISISRDHKQPIKRSEFNKVLYNVKYHWCFSTKLPAYTECPKKRPLCCWLITVSKAWFPSGHKGYKNRVTIFSKVSI